MSVLTKRAKMKKQKHDKKTLHQGSVVQNYREMLAEYAVPANRQEWLERLACAGRAAKECQEAGDIHAEYSECLYQMYRYDEALREAEFALSLGQLPGNLEAVLRERRRELQGLVRKAAELKITACAIVRNEAGNIRAWLESSRMFADELVVVDTGSEDDTVEIVRQYGIQPMEIAWEDDFAKAKNVALEAAHGEWIVFNDADEVFMEPQAVRGFLASIDGMKKDIVMLPLSSVNSENKEIERLLLVRAFRNLPYFRYAGRIHEELLQDGRQLDNSRIVAADDRLLVRHTGYHNKVAAEKCRRNLRMLLHEQEEFGENIGRFGYLADCYIGMGDYVKALDYALRFIQSGQAMQGREGTAYCEALICLEKLGYGTDDRLAVIADGMRHNPDLPDFYGEKGIVYAELGRYVESYRLLHKALDIYMQVLKSERSSKGTNFGGSVIRAMYMLGLCAKQMGRNEEAESFFYNALQLKPFWEPSLVAVADAFEGKVCQDLLLVIEKAFPDWKKHTVLLGDIFCRHGFIELQRYFYPAGMGYASMAAGGVASAADRIAAAVPRLFAAVLGHEETVLVHNYRSPVEMLPEACQNLVKIYFSGEFYPELVLEQEFCQSLLPAVLQYGTVEAQRKYLKLAAGIGINNSGSTKSGTGEAKCLGVDDIRNLTNEIAMNSLYIVAAWVSGREYMEAMEEVCALLPPAYSQLLTKRNFAKSWGSSYEENALCRLLMYAEKNKG